MDLYVYISENESSFESETQLVWMYKNLTYCQLDYPIRKLETTISISEVSIPTFASSELELEANPFSPQNVQNNGSLYLHLYMVKSGLLPSSFKDSQMNGELCCFIYPSESKTVHRSRRLNVYKRMRLDGGQFSDELHSHWHPNLVINLVHKQTDIPMLIRLISISTISSKWSVKFVTDNLSSCFELIGRFSSPSSNFLRDYQPINRTTKSLPLYLTFSRLDSWMFWRFRELSQNPAIQFGNVRFMKYVSGFFGWFDRRLIKSEEDQDQLRQKLIDSGFMLRDVKSFEFAIFLYLFLVTMPTGFLLELSVMSVPRKF